MGGIEYFEGLTTTERMWAAIWHQSSKEMAFESLAVIAQSVPVAKIFSKDSPDHFKWQRYMKTTFVWAAENTFRYRYQDDGKTDCFKAWRAFLPTPAMAGLNLGSILDVPVKTGGPWDQGRRTIGNRVELGDDFQLEVRFGCHVVYFVRKLIRSRTPGPPPFIIIAQVRFLWPLIINESCLFPFWHHHHTTSRFDSWDIS